MSAVTLINATLHLKRVTFLCTFQNTTDKLKLNRRFFFIMARFPQLDGCSPLRHAIQMTAYQLPFVVNCATTCHKLQGSTKKDLLI